MSATKLNLAAVALIFWCGPAAAAPAFVCQEDIPAQTWTDSEREILDVLWRQTLGYLRGFAAALETPAGCLDSARAVTQTVADTDTSRETECIARYRDVELALKHLNAILEHPEEAQRCFDPQKYYGPVALYTPNQRMKSASPAADWLDRPTLAEYYGGFAEAEISAAGIELADSFADLLARSLSPEAAPSDITYNGLPDLWTAVGWIPFYAENERALNPRFRGGYAYAEVMGPWGMLRLESIDGESVGLELGMTIQLGDTFYPYHFHHPQEIYITLSEPGCARQNEYFAMHWDNPKLEQSATADGWQVNIRPSVEEWFLPTTPARRDRLTYFERNAIHAFTAGGACEGEGEGAGLVTIWARTTSRDNEQTTRICSLDGAPRHGQRPATPDADYICELRHWAP